MTVEVIVVVQKKTEREASVVSLQDFEGGSVRGQALGCQSGRLEHWAVANLRLRTWRRGK